MRSNFQAQQSDFGSYWTSDARSSDLTAGLRTMLMTSKRADDNPGTDDFERSFSSLAHQYIKSRAPQLIDYAIGFQTIKRVDDPAKSKAVGVFGFKVDDLWLFVPVFFLQGDLKGHELLWVKNRDNFLPCKENWVTFLINRQPTELGEPSNGSFQALGGKKPSFRRLFQPQFFGQKMASMQPWAKQVLPLFAAMDLQPEKVVRKTADYTAPFNLADEAMADPLFVIRLNEVASAYPLIKQGLDTWYPNIIPNAAMEHKKTAGDILSDKVKTNMFPTLKHYAAILDWPARFSAKRGSFSDLFAETPKPAFNPASKVQVMRTMESVFDAGEAIKRKFATDGYAIIDDRADAEVNKVAADEINHKLMTPSKSGLYETAMQDGETKKMIVFMSTKAESGRTLPGCLVINPESKEQYARFPSNEVLAQPDNYVNTVLEDDRDAGAELKTWLKNNSTKDISVNGIYIAVDEQLNTTVPFIVTEKTENDRFRADGRDWQTARLGVDDKGQMPLSSATADYSLNQPGRKIVTGRGWVSIPAGAWIIKLEQRSEDDRWKDNKTPALGNTETVLSSIQRKYAKCDVFHDGETFEVKVNRKSASFNREREVVIDLMLRGNLREKEARDIVSMARRNSGHSVMLKLAYDSNFSPDIPDPWTGSEPVGPNKSIDAIYRQREDIPLRDMVHPDPGQHYSEDQWFSPDTQMLSLAQQASASGQKDLFDIGVLVALANTTDTETMVDRFLGRYMSAIDGLGRTLFHIYNNYESLAERYGNSDMPQLEDGVRNTFTALGDTTLYLKEKSVGGSNGFNATGEASPDISEATTM